MNKTILRKIFGCIAALITAVFIFAVFLCGVAYIATSEKYITSTVERTEYIEGSVSVLEGSLNSLTIPSGLPEDFFVGKINITELKNINTQCIEKNYISAPFNYDTANLQNELVTLFKDYANSAELADKSNIDEAALEHLAELCVKDYKNTGGGRLFRMLSLYSGRINKYIPIAAAATTVLGLIGVIFLYKLVGKFVRNNYLYFSFAAAGIMLIAAPAWAVLSGTIRGLGITPQPALNFVCGYLEGAMYMLIAAGALLLVLSVIFRFVIKIKL